MPSAELRLEVEPRVADQELRMGTRYWEGVMRVVGTSAGQRNPGQGLRRARRVRGVIRRSSASGFAAQTKDNVQVGIGTATTVDFEAATANVSAVVNIQDSGVMVDATETKAQDNISAREIEALPKGTGFTSLLRTTASVPGWRRSIAARTSCDSATASASGGAWCGTVGLKVTAGRISTFGVLPLSTTLDTPGPLTRSVEDAVVARVQPGVVR